MEKKEEIKQNILVSIIIPIYNVKAFLPRCIESLLNQTYRNLELILVDDGSTDGSSDICDEYSRVDNRIIVIHTKNEGCSAARNRALKIYKGEELAFVDPDDFVEPEYIEKMHNAMQKHNADVVICDFDYVDEKGGLFCLSKQKLPTGKCSKDDLLYNYVLFNKDVFYMTVLWNKLYRREIVGDFQFPCRYRNFEDSYWCPNVFLKCNFGLVINDVLYHYTNNNNSLTHQAYSPYKKEALKQVSKWKRIFLVENTDIKEAKLVALLRENEVGDLYFKNDKTWKREIKNNYRKIYKHEKYKTSISMERRLKFFIAFISMNLYRQLAIMKGDK